MFKKTAKGIYEVGSGLEKSFGIVEFQENATNGIGCNL